jgi:flagellar motor protein MotB
VRSWILAGAILIALPLSAAGCGSTTRSTVTAMDEVERARNGAAAREGKELAPQTFALAEEHRRLSREAYAAGDEPAASLHAERALATFQHALVLARLARADGDRATAATALAAAASETEKLRQARAELDRAGDDLDKKLKIAREAALPASAPADPQREAARLVAARALAIQARLLCGAARLLSTTLPGLAESEKELAEVEKKLEGTPKPTPIDATARARASCLLVLTRARRTSDKAGAGQADALLAELSATGGWSPVRDERGVVVTLRDAFKGAALTPEADGKMKELGRVLAAHPGHAAQVVVHDATTPTPAEVSVATQRAEAAAKSLGTAANAPDKVKPEVAGARAPIVDPADAKNRARNARLDVVFVTPGN